MSTRAISIVFSVLVAISLNPISASADVKTGLAGYWPLNGDGTDASTNRNDGTVTGDVSPAPNRYGIAGSALRFPGDPESYLNLGDPAPLRITGAMTVAAWVLLDGSNANPGRIITKRGAEGNESWDLGLEAAPDGDGYVVAYQVALDSSQVVRVTDTAPLPVDRWIHVVGVYRPAEALEIYIDGQLRSELTSGVPGNQFSDNGSPVWIGSRQDCSDCGWNGLLDEVRLYDRPLGQVEIWQLMRAEVGLSSNPQPPDGATGVPRDITFRWTSGQFARTHDVYFGPVYKDVNEASRTNPKGVLASQGRIVNTYIPASDLDFARTYYWRVDEVNAFDSIIYKGNVWTFTVEPYAPIIENVVASTNAVSNDNQTPDKTIDGSGLNDHDEHSTEAPHMWLATADGPDPIWIQYRFDTTRKLQEMHIWNYNEASGPGTEAGLKDVAVEYSTDGTEWSTLKDVEIVQASGTPEYAANTTVALGGIVARYVRLMVHTNWGAPGQYGLSEVRFAHVPMRARYPQPADGEAGVDVELVLHWSAGRDVAFHEVHFSPSAPLVATGAALLDSVAVNEYPLRSLDFGTPYYWRIDERNDARDPALWAGEIWTFTTRQYATFDDFESYTDESGRRIYEIWRDGYDNGTGALVGYMEAPFAEKSLVHGGGQSMPFNYNNGESPFYSEAVRPMAMEQNWLEHGANTLRLFVRGRPDNDPGSLYLAIEDKIGRVAVATHPDPTVLTTAAWQEWTIPYSAFDSISLAGVQTVYLGVGDRDNPSPGGSGLIYIDDIEFGRPSGGQAPARR